MARTSPRGATCLGAKPRGSYLADHFFGFNIASTSRRQSCRWARVIASCVFASETDNRSARSCSTARATARRSGVARRAFVVAERERGFAVVLGQQLGLENLEVRPLQRTTAHVDLRVARSSTRSTRRPARRSPASDRVRLVGAAESRRPSDGGCGRRSSRLPSRSRCWPMTSVATPVYLKRLTIAGLSTFVGVVKALSSRNLHRRLLLLLGHAGERSRCRGRRACDSRRRRRR